MRRSEEELSLKRPLKRILLNLASRQADVGQALEGRIGASYRLF